MHAFCNDPNLSKFWNFGMGIRNNNCKGSNSEIKKSVESGGVGEENPWKY